VATAFGVLVLVATLPGAAVLLAGWLRAGRSRTSPVVDARSRALEVVHSGAREGGAAHV